MDIRIINIRSVIEMLNKQKEMNMMKHRFLSIILMFAFCLTAMPVLADDVSVEKKLKAYPNPVDRGALLTVEIPDDRGEMTLFLYNTVGKEIQKVTVSGKKVEFHAPDVGGIYLLRFVEKQKVIAVEKIVVKE